MKETSALKQGGAKTIPSQATGRDVSRLDHFFSSSAARLDRWRELNARAQTWAAEARRGNPRGERGAVEAALTEVRALENFFAYPGLRLMIALADRIADDDAMGVARLLRRISGALLSGSYRYDSGEWETADDTTDTVADRLPLAPGGGESRRPYFETLFVSPAPAASLAKVAQEIRRLRRVEDAMVYEPVLVGSFEDAILGTVFNGKIEAVVIYDGIPIPSQHDVPLLRAFLSTYQNLDTSSLAPREIGVTLARAIKRIRPELDIYLLTDRKVEQVAGDPAASMIRRVFYEVEELMEVHLNILEGVADRFSTPHFDNLKRYAARPISTFHALPIARGKSIIKSNWIHDMGEFYGQNLFLAESSRYHRRSRQHARADRQHQDGPGEVRPRRRSGPRILRYQRNVHVQQDGLPGGDQARRYRDCRPQLPQVAPLRDGSVRGPAALRRGLPDDGVFDVRRGAAAHQSSRPCSTSRPRDASTA